MSDNLKHLRADLANSQRLAGVALADTLRMIETAKDVKVLTNLVTLKWNLIDRIEDATQRLLDIDTQISLLASSETLRSTINPN